MFQNKIKSGLKDNVCIWQKPNIIYVLEYNKKSFYD